MASEHVHEFTDTNFEEEVLQSDQPVVVDFWAEWCMPCKMIAPLIDQLAKDYEGKVKVGKLDTEAARETAIKYGITSIPTLMLFQGGQVTKQVVGGRASAGALASELGLDAAVAA